MLATNNGSLPVVKPARWVVYAPTRKAIVIATHNKAPSIQGEIQRILNEGSVAIVVDEGSTDGTSQAAEAAGAWVIHANPATPFATAIRQAIRLAASLGDEILVTRG